MPTHRIFSQIQNFLKILGPGLLFAGIAIGASHLVQSTRAGAEYGLKLIIFVILANVLKYPFFEFGVRYTAVTGKNLLQAYWLRNPLYLKAFFVLNIITATTTISAVSFVSANILAFIFSPYLNVIGSEILVFAMCTAILWIGKYRWLDRTIKLILSILAISTITAFGLALHHSNLHHFVAALPSAPSMFTLASFTFILALMGWMPAPVEASVWNSLWAQARETETGLKVTKKESLLDFNVGYWATAFLALMFLGLGALAMFGTGETFSNSGVRFIEQLIALFQKQFGGWSIIPIAVAAFCTMFSTTLTCLDAYSRALSESLVILSPSRAVKKNIYYGIAVATFIILSIVIGIFFVTAIKTLLDIATVFAFLTAPIFAFLNYQAITDKSVSALGGAPGTFMLWLSRIGLVFFVILSLAFIGWWFIA